MTKIDCTLGKRTFTHLNNIQRGRLGEMARQEVYTQAEMTKELGVS